MTIIFRTSSFFVIFVITLKATTFIVGNTSGGDRVADRLNNHVERLVNEAVRFRKETREAADRIADMAVALHVLGDRVIECSTAVARSLAGSARSAWQAFCATLGLSGSVAIESLPHPQHALTKKEVVYGGYIAA